jgi:hypothetical protein
MKELLAFILLCCIAIGTLFLFLDTFAPGKLQKTNMSARYDQGYKQAVIEMYEHPELQKDMYKTAKGF